MCRQIVFPMPTRVRERAINGDRTGNIFDSFRHFGFPGKPGRILLRMPFQTFKNDQKVRIGRGKNSPSFRRLRAKKTVIASGNNRRRINRFPTFPGENGHQNPEQQNTKSRVPGQNFRGTEKPGIFIPGKFL